tara:strand:+ start:5303 stop:6079 length:777 start_codon:yes stop_codon:yes gene_type:complete
MKKFDKLNKKFLKSGYLIEKVENKKALKYINNLIKNKLCNLLKLKNPKKFSINNIHNIIKQSDLNLIRVKLINYLNNDKKFREQYFEIAKNILFSIVGNELAMQNNVNLSIQIPNDESSLLPLHSDTWSGDSPFEIVVWLPLVDCYKTKSMFILKQKQNEKFRKFFSNKNLNFSSQLHKKFKKDLIFLKINYGEFLLFNQNLPHGNVINITKETRLSLNCRFKGLFTPYAQKKLGSFFSPLIVRPASKIGLNYKFPGE